MNAVLSKDGTSIAFDRVGAGPPLVVVGGAFSYRRWKGFLRLADLLQDRFTVVNYDRRGRGDSSDTPLYAVERELEDLHAVIDAVGESAHVWGISSGAVLALRAAAAGISIERLAVYQPPFLVDRTGHVPPTDFEARLHELVGADQRAKTVGYFMTQGMGVPRPVAGLMRLAPPLWSRLKAVAHTLPYDYAVMGETVQGEPLAPRPWTGITTPTLVLDGGKSPASLRKAADAIAELLPNAERRTLDRQSHNVSTDVLAPVLAEFFAREDEAPSRTVAASE